MLARPDHLVVAAAGLAEGIDHVETLLGVGLTAGGRHAVMGTHNALLSLGPGFYLEVIAVDPEAPPPVRARWFGLDAPPSRPRLSHWVARTADIGACLAVPGVPAAEVVDMARGDFRWRFAVTADGVPPYVGAFPALIQWQAGGHPSQRLPDRGCRLVRLAVSHPEAGALRRGLHGLGLTPAIVAAPAAIEAVIATPGGEVTLT